MYILQLEVDVGLLHFDFFFTTTIDYFSSIYYGLSYKLQLMLCSLQVIRLQKDEDEI